MSQILGYIGIPNNSDDLYPKGVFHLEKNYESHLKGLPGKVFNEVNSKGRIIREISIEKPIKGKNLDLTVDLELQDYAQSLLPKENKGSIVIMNCQDGSILSMNSNPTFDAQVFEDKDNKTINKLLNDKSKPF